MRSFLPITALELCSKLPLRELVDVGQADLPADEQEWLEYEASVTASFISLELIRDSSRPIYRRVVVALEGDVSWQNAKAILVDGAAAEHLVRRACDARTQDEADEVLDELLEESLEWFDVSEREELCKALAGL